VRVASGPDKAGAWPALPDGYGSGERVEEVYARNRCVKPPKVSHQLQPGGCGLGAARARPIVGWATSGLVRLAGLGGHGERPRRRRGDAAGDSRAPPSTSDRLVNTGTVPVLPRATQPAWRSGLGPPSAGRAGTGRSRRSPPRSGTPIRWRPAAAGSCRGELQCPKRPGPTARRRAVAASAAGAGTGDAGQAAPLGGGRCWPPVC
jgi:hypothetical protein